MKIKDKVTQHVIDGVEAGSPPWIRGWSDDGTKSTLCLAPRNGLTQRPYSGINWLILGMFNPYKSNEWFTANNAVRMFACGKCNACRRRSFSFCPTGNPKPIPYEEFKNSTRIIFYKEISYEDKHGEEQWRPTMRTYSVWNREQIPDLPKVERTSQFDPKSTIDEMLVNLKLKGGVHVGGDRACYVPSEDAVCIPNDDAFDTPADATSVKAHEGCHATGAEHRLNRGLNKAGPANAGAYAYEELIAELGSAMVCASLGIPLDKLRHTDYIGVWLKRLKDDRNYIFKAAADANKAMQYLMKEAA